MGQWQAPLYQAPSHQAPFHQVAVARPQRCTHSQSGCYTKAPLATVTFRSGVGLGRIKFWSSEC